MDVRKSFFARDLKGFVGSKILENEGDDDEKTFEPRIHALPFFSFCFRL